jgi:hypothetical protein
MAPTFAEAWFCPNGTLHDAKTAHLPAEAGGMDIR